MRILIGLILFSFMSCSKKQLQPDGKYINQIKHNLITFDDGSEYQLATGEDAKVVYLVRHAEKDTIPKNNPYLTDAGFDRAFRLAHIFKQTRLDKVYSTLYNRTMLTVDSLTQMKGLSTDIYQPKNIKNLSSGMLTDSISNCFLVVGHSNTTPALASVLMGSKQFDQGFDEDDYDNMLIINVKKDGTKELLKLKYKSDYNSKK